MLAVFLPSNVIFFVVSVNGVLFLIVCVLSLVVWVFEENR